MPQILEVVLLLALTVSLVVQGAILFVVSALVQHVKKHFLQESCCEHSQPQVWTSSAVPPPEIKNSAVAHVDKTLFQCEHCGSVVNGVPVRQIIGDEGNFLVYNCEFCGQETANPAVD